MSSATSIDPSTRSSRELRAGPVRAAEDSGLRPWQFFVLAGMLSATAVVIVATGQSPASIIVLSLTVVATSLVALGTYRALAPLVLPEEADTPRLIAGRTRAALEREKTLALRSIKELEFDFAMGKISKDDFDEMGGRLRARAIGLMRQLDSGGFRSAIEQELQARLSGKAGAGADRSKVGASAPTGVVRADDARRDAASLDAIEAPDVAPPVCSCGVVNDADARFCKSCGTRF
jgi:hypothetical protein